MSNPIRKQKLTADKMLSDVDIREIVASLKKRRVSRYSSEQSDEEAEDRAREKGKMLPDDIHESLASFKKVLISGDFSEQSAEEVERGPRALISYFERLLKEKKIGFKYVRADDNPSESINEKSDPSSHVAVNMTQQSGVEKCDEDSKVYRFNVLAEEVFWLKKLCEDNDLWYTCSEL